MSESKNNPLDSLDKELKIDNLFSIPFVQYQLKDFESMNKDLKEIILKKEKESPTTLKSNQGGWQSEGDFFRWGGESIEKLNSIFMKVIQTATTKLDFFIKPESSIIFNPFFPFVIVIALIFAASSISFGPGATTISKSLCFDLIILN